MLARMDGDNRLLLGSIYYSLSVKSSADVMFRAVWGFPSLER